MVKFQNVERILVAQLRTREQELLVVPQPPKHSCKERERARARARARARVRENKTRPNIGRVSKTSVIRC